LGDQRAGTGGEMKSRAYADPYIAGVGIGLVLLAAYAVAGRGLGASGAFSTVVAAGTVAVRGHGAAASPAVAPYLGDGILHDWLVLELCGVALGGFLSAWLAGRFHFAVERGPHLGVRGRVAASVCGGVLRGIGAKFARGCTSGQALTGGALLSAGSWLFIAGCFATAYLLSPVARRLWR
jgi:uncharacterized membrane protein YedE/YeeE